MLDKTRVALQRLRTELAAGETVGAVRLVHNRAEAFVVDATAAGDSTMLERAAGIAYDAERKLGKLADADDDLGPNAERCRRRAALDDDEAARDRERIIAARRRRIGAPAVPGEAASMVLVPPSRDGRASWYFEPGGIAVRYLVAIPKQPNDTPDAVRQKLARETIRAHEGDLAHLVEATIRCRT
jgi:hypothetical protein